MYKSYKKTISVLVTCALISVLLCLPVSALSVSSYGFSITNCQLGWGSSPTQCISNNKYGNVPIHYNDNQLEFRGLSGNSVAASFYRPLVLTIESGNTHASYTINVKYVSYYADSGNNAYNFDGSPFAFVNGSQPSNFKTYSRYDANGEFMYYGGEFTYTVNKNTTTTLYLCSGYNEVSAYTHGFSVWFDIQGNDNSQAIIDNENNNKTAIINNQNQNAADIKANQDANTDREIESDKENTQAIIDNQNELAEKEKQEISDSGNQATDAGENIPNESEGFINALGTFVSTMSTTDTDCSITFPSIKIPSFAGIPAATLSEEKEVDFSQAISLIPSDIMKLIQALTTIALIVFCFKELYDTISEALTRKKANSDG